MKRKLVIAAVAASVVIGGGAAVAFADDETHSGTAAAGAQVVSKNASDGAGRVQVSSARTTAAEAVAAALKHTPGTAVGADREDDGADAGAWQVDVVRAGGTEYTVVVSSATGEVLGAHRDGDADDDGDGDGREDLAALKGASVDAREAALAVAGKGTVTDVDLDDDDHAATVWSVDTAQGVQWTVDARTGKVTQDLDD
ncbi:PepSY domain-containing protein [Streptomyces sp. NBC_01275]|uniref:PepSY domain-containing protein n=1 Tax=Streptomyces sp. NBC_01275 TaxID=2903807 RepID=UPI002257165A|nr:PepSY domain-containing protein [Streptomyces sp. NBC_01275]MCX4765030.1 PepSY domain-containing protein [Streptomyces sp. NBC_01275]